MSESLGSSQPPDKFRRPHVVIIGGGFAGIAAVKALRHCEADVTVIDRSNHHIFQPLLYQVATAALAQMAKTTLRANFRRIDPATTSIVLLDGAKRVLPSFAESSSIKAAQRLAKLGVKVITSAMVEHIDDQGVTVGGKRIDSGTVLWTAGVSPSPIVKMLGVATDRAGRACVGPFLNVADSRGIFVVGDAATLIQDGRPLPGVAQVAIQEGRYVGGWIARELGGGKTPRPFRYFDKGNMAVIGKNFAILESGRIKLAGVIPWFIWAFIHIMFLPQLQNQRRVQNQWFWSYFTGQRSSRLVDEALRI